MSLVHRFLNASWLAACVLGAGMVSPAAAQNTYPNRPIKIVVPFEAGGGSDVFARLMAQKLGQQMNTSVIVDNRPGANGMLAAEMVSRAPPDGYTLMFHTSGLALLQALKPKGEVDVLRDLTPISLVGTSPLVLTVKPALGVNTIAEFVALVKANPGKLSYASAGVGNVTHLTPLLFLQSNGLDAIHVPYKGGAPAVQAVASGVVDFTTQTPTAVAALAKEGRVRPLAVTTLKRAAVMPDVPTLNETLMPEFDVGTWQAMMAPANTPPAIIQRLHAEVVKVLADRDVLVRLQAMDTSAIGSSPEQYRTYLGKEIERWRAVIQKAGVKPE